LVVFVPKHYSKTESHCFRNAKIGENPTIFAPMFSTTQKIGILGGGQLGKMLCLAAANWDFKTYILDPTEGCPASQVCTQHTLGDFSNYDDVLAFGKDKDLITIEIEHVNTDALRALQALGKIVHPNPDALDVIKDKGLQKDFYHKNGIPTARYEVFEDEQALYKAIEAGRWHFPLVQKTRTAGYDGKGVAVLRTKEDLETKLLKGACIAEELVDVQVELAVIAAKNPDGEVAVFPAVEMDFHPEANLVEFLLCPARVSNLVEAEAEALAERVIRALDICGLLAVELFLTKSGELLVNESAPRPHNSGHHTIDSAITSQFEQHLRAITGLPLGSGTQKVAAAVMINLLGEAGQKGPVQYEGAEQCLALDGVYLHLYGKELTSPFRKMGHANITADSIEAAIKKADLVKKYLKVVTVDGRR